jgi:AcrR family transcriptional regulator
MVGTMFNFRIAIQQAGGMGRRLDAIWTCFAGWLMTQRKYEIADFRQAIQAAGASPALIAARLGCSRGTVYAYLRKYPKLKAAFEAQKGAPVEERTQFPKEVFEQAISESHGVKASVAAAVQCSRQTVDNALERWPDLREKFDAARSELVSQAVSALVTDVTTAASDGHQRAYMFVLRTLGKDEGFTERSEVTGADGAGLLDVSPETMKLIDAMGMDPREIARHLDAMVKAAAAQKGLVGGE